ncbi:MAG: ergothioneine biosynthesis protein EgtB [Bacteroidetes Order II. Incertae sedis bacterium]|nr:ergothioneine biosynthesis protein EgtB [Bacteroidetes Order II. bacterium]
MTLPKAPTVTSHSSVDSLNIANRFESVRKQTEAICAPLEIEDYVIQSMPDTSPMKWHLAHTTWFFETFVLKAFTPSYSPFDERFAFLFNSYYVQAGERFVRHHRGLLSRPTVKEVYAYRSYVDEAMMQFLSHDLPTEAHSVLETGLNHEQQHQELIVTDLKHNLSVNPLFPAYSEQSFPLSADLGALSWHSFDEGIVPIGHESEAFHFDNELPIHRQFLEPFELANRPVTNGEFEQFITSGGYNDATLWLSEGFYKVQTENWQYPIYWIPEDGGWSEFTLYGKQPLDPNAPATHLSYFEADAFARWAGYRLPTEFELETVLKSVNIEGHFSHEMIFHPHFSTRDAQKHPFVHLFGSAWEWTNSHYSPYPGYKPVAGALGEYNGKFMANQFVLRGGSCATPKDHIRPTYRNFFPTSARWQFSAIRLTKTK